MMKGCVPPSPTPSRKESAISSGTPCARGNTISVAPESNIAAALELAGCHVRVIDMFADKLDGQEVIDKAVLVYGQMNEPPGSRLRVALTALTQAEYFRDTEGQDVLLFVDNIFRFTQAGSEVSALLGRMPSAVGYQPTLGTEMGALQERITSTNKGSITSVQAIYVPADDLTDPAPATAFSHLDATTVLSRQIAELGIYPAVDPLDSTSRILDPRVVGEEHYQVARQVQQHGQHHRVAGVAVHAAHHAAEPPLPVRQPFDRCVGGVDAGLVERIQVEAADGDRREHQAADRAQVVQRVGGVAEQAVEQPVGQQEEAAAGGRDESQHGLGVRGEQRPMLAAARPLHLDVPQVRRARARCCSAVFRKS